MPRPSEKRMEELDMTATAVKQKEMACGGSNAHRYAPRESHCYNAGAAAQ